MRNEDNFKILMTMNAQFRADLEGGGGLSECF